MVTEQESSLERLRRITASANRLQQPELVQQETPGLLGRFWNLLSKTVDVSQTTARGLMESRLGAAASVFEERGQTPRSAKILALTSILPPGVGIPSPLSLDITKKQEELLGVEVEAGHTISLGPLGIRTPSGFKNFLEAAYRNADMVPEFLPHSRHAAWLYDPLNIVPVTTLPKIAFKAAVGVTKGFGRVGTLAQRLERAREAIPEALRPQVDRKKYAQLLTDEVLQAEGYELNTLRKIAIGIHRSPFGKIPPIKQVLYHTNPSGLINKVDERDKLAMTLIDWRRLQDNADTVVTTEISLLRRLTQDPKLFRTFEEGGNLFMNVKRMPGRPLLPTPADILKRGSPLWKEGVNVGVQKVSRGSIAVETYDKVIQKVLRSTDEGLDKLIQQASKYAKDYPGLEYPGKKFTASRKLWKLNKQAALSEKRRRAITPPSPVTPKVTGPWIYHRTNMAQLPGIREGGFKRGEFLGLRAFKKSDFPGDVNLRIQQGHLPAFRETGLPIAPEHLEIFVDAAGKPLPLMRPGGTWKPLVDPLGGYRAKVRGMEAEKVPFQDVIERYGDFQLSTEQRAAIKIADDLIDGYFTEVQKSLVEGAVAKAVGVRAKELARRAAEKKWARELTQFGKHEHYFPRFVKMIGEIANRKSATGGRAIGAKPGVLASSRLHDMAEEAINNGTVYMGAGSRDPLGDIVETYMKGAMKVITDARLADNIRAMGSTLNQRVGAELLERVTTTRAASQVLAGKRGQGGLIRALVKVARNPKHIKLTASETAQLKRIHPQWGTDYITFRRLQNVERKKAAIDALVLGVKEEGRRRRAEAALARFAAKTARQEEKVRLDLGKVWEPAFSGYLFPREVADYLGKALREDTGVFESALRGGGALPGISDISSMSRLGTLTLDQGASLLQGALLLANAPVAWVKAASKSFLSLIDPAQRQAYLGSDDVQRLFHFYGRRLHMGSPEFMEAVQPGGYVARTLPKVPGGTTLFRQVFGRFSASYEMFFDVARMEMGQAYLPAIQKGAASVDDVAQHINKMTGVISTKRLGVSATQREVESVAFFLAPRWTRAMTGLMAQSVQGGWQGAESRRAFGKFFVGTVAAYIAVCTALNKPIHLDPRSRDQGGDGADFMMLEVDGHHLGLGGKAYSIVRTVVRAGASDDPEEAAGHISRWFRGSAAPLTSAVLDVVPIPGIAPGRETFIGEPVKTPLQFFRHEIEGRLLPFWLEARIADDPPAGWIGMAGDFFGLRSWPKQRREYRDELRDELAALIPLSQLAPDQRKEAEETGLTWDVLSYRQKQRITQGETGIQAIDTRQAELEKWQKLTTAQQQERGDIDLNTFFREGDTARAFWETHAGHAAFGSVIGRRSPAKFLKTMQDINTIYGTMISDLYQVDGDHAEALTKLQEMTEGKEFVPLEDVARAEYIATVIANPDLEDAFGDFLPERAKEHLAAMVSKYGQDTVNNIEASFRANKEVPPLWHQWHDDKSLLERYWNAQERYLLQNPETNTIWRALQAATRRGKVDTIERLKKHPRIIKMRRTLTRVRQQLRDTDPEVDAALYFWGKATRLRTLEARILLEERRRRLL